MNGFDEIFDPLIRKKKVVYQRKCRASKTAYDISQRSIDPNFWEVNEPLVFDEITVKECQHLLIKDFGSNISNPKISVETLYSYIEWIIDDVCHDFSYLACFEAYGIEKCRAYEIAHDRLESLYLAIQKVKPDSKQCKVLSKALHTYFY
ncbi:hypothetical protein [Vibrio agarivorans]|uniref:Uncharacterized protein n=1 Tax=Vibrio agarivorans TaxID=153622 RepID=A0ABT7Y7G0_9VIBR|nr:hypothetical protein [Vibrio agarivorans]MDN2483930.1 hypothetical protein [Vibrio agarivorans]